MRICIISSAHQPFDDRIYYKETISLLKEYNNIHLIAPKSNTNKQVHNEKIIYHALWNSNSLYFRIINLLKVVWIAKKLKPDVCHVHDYELILIFPILHFFFNCKIIYDVHENYPEMMGDSQKFPKLIKPLLAKVVELLEISMSKFASYIITTDENTTQKFMKFHKNVITIFNYPDLEGFAPQPERVQELKNFFTPYKLLIYQGSISRERGLFLMLDAVKSLKRIIPNVMLLLVGPIDEILKFEAEKQIKKDNIQENVRIIGSVPHLDVVNYISISRIGLIPLFPTKKYIKSLPIKQFEYMVCGIPVIATNLPLISKFIESAKCGFTINIFEQEIFIDNIIKLLDDELLWKKMSISGEKAVNEKWNWKSEEKKLISIYGKLKNLI